MQIASVTGTLMLSVEYRIIPFFDTLDLTLYDFRFEEAKKVTTKSKGGKGHGKKWNGILNF